MDAQSRPFSKAVVVAAGHEHTVALRSDGTVWGWGSDYEGQLGDAGYQTYRYAPVQAHGVGDVGFLSDIVNVVATSNRTLALRSDGAVFTWGDSVYSFPYVPVPVYSEDGAGTLTGVSGIATGSKHSLALLPDGTVLAWGDNSDGQLGHGDSPSYAGLPVHVKGVGGTGLLTGVSSLACGSRYSVALMADGTVTTWGQNTEGELGDGSSTKRTAPVQVKGEGGTGLLTGVTAVAASVAVGYLDSPNLTLALKADGSVWAWGSNNEGQLGDGTWTDSTTPVHVKGPGGAGFLADVIAIAAGESHSLALKSDGTIWAWGRNQEGQLGNLQVNWASNTPVRVTGLNVNTVCATLSSCGASGECIAQEGADGTPCGDSDRCNGDETCQGGLCDMGTPVVCDAQPPCHPSTCNPTTGVCSSSTDADGSPCHDDDACYGGDYCVAGACHAGTFPLYCGDPGECKEFAPCVPSLGQCELIPKADGTPCVPQTMCLTNATCLGGVCSVGTAVSCDDGEPCTTDTCSSWQGCMHSPVSNGTACDDANPCTQNSVCNAGICTGSSPIQCSAIDPCHVQGTCDSSTGACSNPAKPNGSSCDDLSACTINESCQEGACLAGQTVSCDDGNPCTDDSCDPSLGCRHVAVAEGSACDDGNVCNSGDRCVAGSCEATSGLDCNDHNPCTADGCDAAAACIHTLVAEGTSCSDGNSCTQNDSCQVGVCQPGTLQVCSASECQSGGACNPTTGLCDYTPQPDETPCSGGLCEAGACVPLGTGGVGGAGGVGGSSGVAGNSGGAGSSATTGGMTGMGGAGEAAGTGAAGGTSTAGSTGTGRAGTQSANHPTVDIEGGCGCRATGDFTSHMRSTSVGILAMGFGLVAARRRKAGPRRENAA